MNYADMNTAEQAEYRRVALFGGVLEAIIWSTPALRFEDDQDMMDDHVTTHDFDGAAIESLESDLEGFCEMIAADIQDMEPGQLGHDFALTRDCHGAGFWDRGYGERGERLTDAAKSFGSVEAYLVEVEGFGGTPTGNYVVFV